MIKKRLGRHTVKLDNPVYIASVASIAGKKESEGPLGELFDITLGDDKFGESTWEKAESRIVAENMQLAIKKASMTASDIDYCITGDLLNQITASVFGIKEIKIPFVGVYGACSTMGEAMGLGSMLIDGGFAENVLVGASSHFCAAEKQFRAPLGMGSQRPPTSTWTTTGDGAVVLTKNGNDSMPFITEVMTGDIVDMNIKDPNNMGAAMAPAAAELMMSYFKETKRDPEYFDVIATGDLGYTGKTLVTELLASEGWALDSRYTDCGTEIFDKDSQDTHSGGSGCACSALVFTAKFYKLLAEGKIKKMLFMPTGALMSPTSSQQGESIPGIAHGVVIESRCCNGHI